VPRRFSLLIADCSGFRSWSCDTFDAAAIGIHSVTVEGLNRCADTAHATRGTSTLYLQTALFVAAPLNWKAFELNDAAARSVGLFRTSSDTFSLGMLAPGGIICGH
jgi:hypothetical protein